MEFAEVYNKAISLLARRDYSVAALTDKLLKYSSDRKLIGQTIQKLLNDKYLDDFRYVELFIRARVAKGYGPLWIRYALMQNGVPENIIDTVFDACGVDWHDLAYQTRIKKFGNVLPLSSKNKHKQLIFLKNRGFDFNHIYPLFKNDDSLI